MMILQLKSKFLPQYATESGQGHELFHLPADDAVLIAWQSIRFRPPASRRRVGGVDVLLDLIGGPRPEVEAVPPLRGTILHRHSRIYLQIKHRCE
ncbi:MAG: hypothetical protein M0P13_01790 [Fibrobacteraceae bacterium]|nr:hypothetical protein [Fibrobacteraceae bacterium]